MIRAKSTSFQLSDKGPKPDKDLIYFHRAYRKLPVGYLPYRFLEVLFLFFLFAIPLFFFFPYLTQFTSYVAKQILSFVIPPETIEIQSRPYLFRSIYYIVSYQGNFPDKPLLLITTIATLIIGIVAVRLKSIPKSIGIWLSFICAINFVSCVFFWLVPDLFPYDIEIFSDLYMITEVSMWFMIPFILPLALIPLPVGLFKKFIVVCTILVYALIFGCIRYVIFFYILSKFSYLFMAILFFAFGPLLDFLCIVGLYGLFVSRFAQNIKGDLSVWHWSY